MHMKIMIMDCVCFFFMYQVVHSIHSFTPRALSNLAAGFSKVDLAKNELFSLISQQAQQQCSNFNSLDTTQLLEAFADVNFADRDLYEVFGQHVSKNFQKFEQSQLDKIACAYVKLELEDENLKDLIEAQLHRLESNNQGGQSLEASSDEWIVTSTGFNTDNIKGSLSCRLLGKPAGNNIPSTGRRVFEDKRKIDESNQKVAGNGPVLPPSFQQ
eukprot:Platyproteum_vivax@DN3870_c0_g1_i1.p2